MLLPCNYVHQYLGYTEDIVSPKCNWDRTDQIQYLGPLNVIIYVNDEKYVASEYGEDAVHRESILIQQKINTKQPSYFEL